MIYEQHRWNRNYMVVAGCKRQENVVTMFKAVLEVGNYSVAAAES
jgi:hypothetical protein